MDEYSIQKKELKNIKMQEQQQNLKKHRRVQSAYKRLLIDKLKEKEDKVKMLTEKKQKVKQQKIQNSLGLRSAFLGNPAVLGQYEAFDE